MDELNAIVNDLEIITTLFVNEPVTITAEDARLIIEFLTWLKEIERISEDAFKDPTTDNIDLYRAQALAKIYAIFLYKGKTIKEV